MNIFARETFLRLSFFNASFNGIKRGRHKTAKHIAGPASTVRQHTSCMFLVRMKETLLANAQFCGNLHSVSSSGGEMHAQLG